jgi:CheY-like chemotaxis protein
MPVSPENADPPARVLIVDDAPDNREVLEIILRWEGFFTLAAASGEEALATVAQHPVDLVLLDIMMPGIDGYGVLAKIKGNSATKNIPVIMVSALEDGNGRALALSAGADDFVAKPLDRANLVLRVRKLLAPRDVVP